MLWFTTLGLLIYCNGFLSLAFSTKVFLQLSSVRLIKDYEACHEEINVQESLDSVFELGMYYDNSFIFIAQTTRATITLLCFAV